MSNAKLIDYSMYKRIRKNLGARDLNDSMNQIFVFLNSTADTH